ncbi:hypothetical protein MZO42_16520 [Sphingomonas psychrotolerans]|uniref:Uncharacterized protein n=1 Tax=Sphingomonas psychrotolerans TaxID=1327635 RepID=A0ABU3N931_9SPHN|nr:hypothetical protein [Sphingomonas psychrotolerans]MDT8760307.1 hypothetical protein [Sphingomonas psychrotolerans]
MREAVEMGSGDPLDRDAHRRGARALDKSEASLQPRFSHDQLRALYERIEAQDVAALTIAGAGSIPAGKRYSHRLRLEAIYKAAGAQPVEYYRITEFVTAVARYQEMHWAWAGRARTGKR